jgi:glycosyltransferase involved in cell wall biosynthesis
VRIVLFKSFPDTYRFSMERYASNLIASITPLLQLSESIVSYLPPVKLSPRWARYLSQYGAYPLSGRFHQGEVNHIVDHAYGHLAWSLDPRRVVVTVHDAIALKTRRGLAQRYNLSGIRRAAHVICDSEATQREFLHLSGYPSERTTVIYLGVGEEFFSDSTGSPFDRLGIPPDHYVLHIGHTMVYKNIPGLLRIFSTLTRSMGLGLRLLRVGGPFSPEQERLARDLGVDDRILHLGYLPQNRLPDLYRCAELLLFPSLDEGFGLPVLEAMASGLPVVCSNRGSLPEIAGDAALLSDPADEPTMARQARDLLQNDILRSQLREAGRRRARQFTWDSTARKTLGIYRRIHEANARR